MSYAASPGPKWAFRLIAGTILALFFAMVASIWWPRVHGAHQRHLLEQCEAKHSVSLADSRYVFAGFDAGGRRIEGSTPKKRAFIDCLRSSLDVATDSEKGGLFPVIEVIEFSFRHEIELTYIPAESDFTPVYEPLPAQD
ncbi:MAG: hypothetical protein AAFP79_05570 [Pseudomonadota bacterium]